jgi:Catalytic LigB subunit of aromatic ring-opening dioxygenase
MGQIVLGIGTSHSPLLVLEVEQWLERAQDDTRKSALVLTDGRVVSYQQLLADVGGAFASEANLTHFSLLARQAQSDLDRLARAIHDAALDAIIIIGDDQQELFSKTHIPAIAIYTGESIDMLPRNQVIAELPDWYRQANKGYQMDVAARHTGAAALGLGIVERLTERGVDVSVSTKVEDARKAGFGHAYGFIFERLLSGRDTPCVPVLLNTYYPPNVPTPARSYMVGQAIRQAVESIAGNERVAVIASGGLTHFVTDEKFDRALLSALAGRDVAALSAIPAAALRSGNSEILNWIMAAGALDGLRMIWSNYVPVRRTAAGTGIGLGFAIWQ